MKRVLITGGSKGIGLGICKVLLEKGYNVVFTSRSEENIRKAIEKLNNVCNVNNMIKGIKCDSSRFDDVKETIEKAFDFMGGIDILINNAGVRKYGNIFDLEVEEPTTITISIFDQLGRRVSQPIIGEKVYQGNRTIQHNVENLSSGIYFISIETPKGKIVKKFVKM